MPEAQTIQKMLMRELHDGMGGIATNMAFSATLGRNEADLQKKDEWLDKLQVLAAEASVEVRELMNALECTSMEWTDVIDALRRISSKVLGEQDITARVHVEGSWPTEEPGLLAGMSLIRMARECISNVVQHACADQVDITAYFSKDLFKLSISDNGCGFDLNTVRRGRGFNRLGKRVPELQGSWHIDSADGTRIIIDIPLPLQAATGNTTKESIK
ncbi:MAG: hypothetical protein K9M54_10430 [Kiritimatiellales bacterium]|nr:hypothetical protein [Kiritimatiellales bacterium]MCF7863744.1 hypothetical protein [Kiritimatiellales bacterium]